MLEDGHLAEIFLERKSNEQQTGNIYKGRIVNVEPSLQAAFVDLGQERNGFLHASDCIPPDGGYSDILRNAAPQAQGRPEQPERPADQGHGQGHENDAAPASAEGEAAGAVGAQAGAAQGQQGQQGEGGGKRRRRRRRGGRGRSGRGRAPAPGAPMVAPQGDAREVDEHGPYDDESEDRGASAEHEDEVTPLSESLDAPEVHDEEAADPDDRNAPPSEGDGDDAADDGLGEEPAHQDQHSEPDDFDDDELDEADDGELDEADDGSVNGDAREDFGEPGEYEDEGEDAGEDELPMDGETIEVVEDAEDLLPEGEVPANGESAASEAPVVIDESSPVMVTSEGVVVPPMVDAVPGAAGPLVAGAAAAGLAPGGTRSRGQRGGRGGGRSGREGQTERRMLIQEMLRKGQEVLVQVVKEGMGQKGPALTTYLSLPGRYMVLMPAVSRLGVSKRIGSESERRALKESLNNLNVPEGMGVIVRTAGMGRSKEDLNRDLNFLLEGWNTLRKKAKVARAPTLIFQEGDVLKRVLRDVFTDDVAEVIVDDPVVAERAREFLREMAPGAEEKVKGYADSQPLFHKHGVEPQLQRLFNRKVPLPGGGSIVIEQTEALVAIDVNTGRFREKRNQDDTILATNLEAAREIARQLRLRDIGGLVMIDFIDMDIGDHRRQVEREFRKHLARDKARLNVLPISALGIVEMTRQRVRHSLRRTLFERCAACGGSGQIKSPESLGLELLREVRYQAAQDRVERLRVSLNPSAAFVILNQFRKELTRLEEALKIRIEVVQEPALETRQFQVAVAKKGGGWVLKKTSEVDEYVRNS